MTTAATFLPYLLFGLPLGAWVDRLDRRRLMVTVDVLRAATIGTIPLLAALDALAVWHVYLVAFIAATLGIAFDTARFAAIPTLVGEGDLVAANGRIQASYSTAAVIGPPLAGFLVARYSTEAILAIDAASFLVSGVSIALIRRPLSADRPAAGATSIRRDIVEGVRYVLGHPVLRAISIMMALINVLASTVIAQLVLFANERLDASDERIGWLFSAGSAGVVAFSLAAGPLRRRFSFSRVALTALVIDGVLTILFASLGNYWLALPVWAALSGAGVLFNINTGSLRQAIVPNHLLGRVISIARFVAWPAIPLGTLTGGWLIETTGNIAAVYAGIGALTATIAIGFAFTALGHAERYLPALDAGLTPGAADAASPTTRLAAR